MAQPTYSYNCRNALYTPLLARQIIKLHTANDEIRAGRVLERRTDKRTYLGLAVKGTATRYLAALTAKRWRYRQIENRTNGQRDGGGYSVSAT